MNEPIYEGQHSHEKEWEMEKYKEREAAEYDEEMEYRDKVWEANNDVKDEKYDEEEQNILTRDSLLGAI
jgi:hypothetical protein